MDNVFKLQEPNAGRVTDETVSKNKSFTMIDMKQYFHIIVKRIWLVAICFVLSMSVMVVKLVKQVPRYNATATLLLSRGLPLPARLTQDEQRQVLGDYLATQKRIVESKEMRRRAEERLDMPVSQIRSKLLGISVYPIGRTAFLGIRVTGYDPNFCAAYANALADAFIDFKDEERMKTSENTLINLTQQANRLHQELVGAEQKVMTFIQDNDVVGIEEIGNIAAANLMKLERAAADYKTQRLIMEAQRPLLSKASDAAVLSALSLPVMSPMVVQSSTNAGGVTEASTEAMLEHGILTQPGWSRLKRKEAVLRAELATYREKFKEEHPYIKQIKEELAEIERAVDLELTFALNQHYAELEALSIKEKAAKRVKQEWEDEALSLSKKNQEYKNLQRNIIRLQSLFDLVHNRMKEVDISVGIEPESVKIMERAVPSSRPITPRKVTSLFIAALIGLGIGLGLVFVLEYIDDSIRYPEEVTSGLGLPFLGVIPAANWDPDDLRAHVLSNIDQKSGLAEAYRNVRSALLLRYSKQDLQTLVLSSAIPREGKTTTCLNLSISFAQAGSRVLLVDADLRRGELHKFFGVEGGRGLSDVLSGNAKPDTVIQRTVIPNLDLVATGPFPANPAELIFRPEMNLFLEYAKRNYDKILFDCPPTMAVSESAIIAALADGVISVIWAGHTSSKLAQLSIKVLRERGANLLGCVLNNLEFGRVGYYYYSTYYGYYNYDYHYGKTEKRKET